MEKLDMSSTCQVDQRVRRMLLYEALSAYGRSDAYPFHMPGHKRNQELLRDMYDGGIVSPYKIDITEIDGFDNLHHAEGILLEAQKRAAELYGAKESFFLINGSTCGLLAAVYACTEQHGAILMARNCHKAVYHAAQLRELKTYYVYPEQTKYSGLNGRIAPSDVEQALDAHPDATAVLVTSPTYDGFVSDISEMAKIVHRQGKLLIVDEAHGAHLGFHEYFPGNSLQAGADIVVHSLHKTLPSYTQTALVSVAKGSRADGKLLRRYLGIFETSSPSYVMMAGMDQCISYLDKKKDQLFPAFVSRLEDFYAFAEKLQQVHVVHETYQDPSKLVIYAEGMSGQQLADVLRNEYQLEVEMAAKGYVIALTSVADTEEGFRRLQQALAEIDEKTVKSCEKSEAKEASAIASEWGKERQDMTADHKAAEEKETGAEAVMTIAQANGCSRNTVKLAESAGMVSGEYLYLYPPGIPLVVPGERITEKLISEALEMQQLGFELQGLEDYTGIYIQVVK